MTVKEIPKPPAKPFKNSESGLSKAQRVLGTGDISIDSPTKEENPSWKYPASRSSRISVTISESSNDNESSKNESFVERFGNDTATPPPKERRLHGKASSTLLGQSYHGDAATSTPSGEGQLRHEDSSSTLRSHYDRQKSPLSVSQQTSASSTRDAALRKGFLPVINRSPLLQMEMSMDPFEFDFSQVSTKPSANGIDRATDQTSREKEPRKKPAKLDLSLLFPRPSRHDDRSSDSPSSMTPLTASTSTSSFHLPSHTPTEPARPRKLTKKNRSKESLQSQTLSVRSNHSHDSRRFVQGVSDLHNSHDQYEQATGSPRLSQIPEARVPSRRMPQETEDVMLFRHDSAATQLTKESRRPSNGGTPGTPGRGAFSWKNVRSSITTQNREPPNMPPPQPIDAPKPSSITSRTSKASKTSRHTNASVLSNSDLKLKSVLSLSSDSEEDNWEHDNVRTSSMTKAKVARGTSKDVSQEPRERSKEDRLRQSPPKGGLSPRGQGSSRPSKSPAGQGGAHLDVPGKYSVPLTPPWPEPRYNSTRSSSKPKTHRRQPSQPKETKAAEIASSFASTRSSHSQQLQQPTPPITPTSVEFREVAERTSRFMAVTKQEEALLEALRLKRTRMREKIIEEHEIHKSPPRTHKKESDFHLEPSSLNTAHNIPEYRQRVLRYLDTPLPKPRLVDMSEPSPDLSDFLSFVSDDDTTPRGSYVAPVAKAKPEIATRSRGSKATRSSTSSVRLSAVGAIGGFKVPRQPEKPRKKRNPEGVRFVDDPKRDSIHDFLMDESDTEGMYKY